MDDMQKRRALIDNVDQVINGESFKAEADRLVKYYNISASAKYTLEPRNDFVKKIVIAFAEQCHLRGIQL